jgi:hypothetical protein
MLCDELAIDGASASGMQVGEVIARIGKAQKFVLSAEFAAVADALSTDYTGIVRAFEHCRLPYANTWIEFVHSERPHFSVAEMHAPAFQVRPKRVGYLLTATRPDLSAWRAHLLWSIPNGQCSAAGLAMDFDMTVPLIHDTRLPTIEDELAEREHMAERGLLNMDMGPHPGWVQSSESVKLAMLRHTNPCMADYDMPLPTGIPRHRWREFYESMATLARADWAGEPSYLLAVIGLLNARNATETVAPDLSRLNKARAKRGVLPLYEHKVLHIARRQVKRVYAEGERRGDHAPMREHFCRGHFKTRKTGIFFWHPHLRGDAARGKIVKEYEL